MPVEIQVEKSVKGRVKLAYFEASGVQCQQKVEAIWKELETRAQQYRQQYASPAEARELLQPARKLYREFGIEPTKVRPSSEALLRRVLQHKPLYQINSIVDVCNLCSLTFLLPIGLYDVDKIVGKIIVRVGREGESYAGIRKEIIHVANRLVLADDNGAFGNPSADSERTAIHIHTTHILWVIFAPHDYPLDQLEEHLRFSLNSFRTYHQGRVLQQGILT